MVYMVKTQRGILAFLLAINTVSMADSVGVSNYLFYVQVVLQICILIGFFIEYELKIADDHLTYRMTLFAMEFHQKRITPKQIKRMKFVRVGWLSKGSIVQVEKGINIRVTHFTPKTVIAELLEFAHKHEITILKTRDFVILEK